MEGVSVLRSQQNGHTRPPAPTSFDPQAVGPTLTGFQRPIRVEGEIFNLEVEGTIPDSIAGTFYRIMPDPAFPPFIENDIWMNGDGVVSSFRIKDGHVDFKQRYVNTEKLKEERKARRALLGKYRNKFTDAVDFRVRTVANTSIVPFRGKIFALKEDGPPYAMDPATLETYGVWDFDGQWNSETFTAHPKYDTITREMVCFGYEAKGVATKDILYGSFDRHGRLTEKVWFKAPVCGFQHEMAMTENWVIFPIIPAHCDLERLKAGGNHWQWEADQPYYIGVLPRRGAKSSDIKWFYGDTAYVGHVANAWEEDGRIHLLMAHAEGNIFGFFPDKEGKAPPPGTHPNLLGKWVIDPKATELHLKKPEHVVKWDNEFLRVDDRFMGYKTRYVFGAVTDNSKGGTDWSLVGRRIGGGFPPFNAIYKKDLQTGKLETYYNGPYRLFQEPVFIPRHVKSPEGDGYLVALTMNYEDMISELVILDTQDLSKHVAMCRLPLRLRMGIHGNWVDDTDVDMHPEYPA
ncbi:Lignostilbene-alpha,beta-dioxygenase isozyme III [Cladophialophora carrionii]|uniref:Lignostilbene-alpha,beta-dioxygenase isozyme III n=1 Tax=Cladophialophora carrionii TaxID=86049 RepID=A0A1C1CLV5_9EURO|nr:Lignostilbene-alpha,beta-dioxygenase isozyme III [Cladophialophora carrionii]